LRNRIDCTFGHKGLAWGAGEHTGSTTSGLSHQARRRRVQPGRVFRVPFAFGTAATAPELKLPYTALTPTIIGVDDVKSRYYNQIVDNTKVERDWDSNEAMVRHDKLYEWGAFIAHNPPARPASVRARLLAPVAGPGRGAACTAMIPDLKRVLTWMDAAKEPNWCRAW